MPVCHRCQRTISNGRRIVQNGIHYVCVNETDVDICSTFAPPAPSVLPEHTMQVLPAKSKRGEWFDMIKQTAQNRGWVELESTAILRSLDAYFLKEETGHVYCFPFMETEFHLVRDQGLIQRLMEYRENKPKREKQQSEYSNAIDRYAKERHWIRLKSPGISVFLLDPATEKIYQLPHTPSKEIKCAELEWNMDNKHMILTLLHENHRPARFENMFV